MHFAVSPSTVQSTNLVNRLFENPPEKISDVSPIRTKRMKATSEAVPVAVNDEICHEQKKRFDYPLSHG